MTPANPSSPLKLGVLLSGGGRTLLNLCDRIDSGGLSAEVVCVIGSRQCAGIARAAARGLNAEVLSPTDSPDEQTYSGRVASRLDEAGADLVLLAGFLSKWLVPQRYAGRVMNIHPALLPSFGGQGMYGHHVHEAVLRRGCKVSGCTVHFVTDEYDAGPIICQRCVPVAEDDTPETLAERVFAVECEAYPLAVQLYAEGRLKVDSGRVRVLPRR
jgi:formyltetrahydrofolate-dependent phosphoribosylglycinamide formyltransferase